jgi:hypothetical protein
MNLIISRNSVLVIIPTTLEVDEGKENEDLSRQRTVCGCRECFSRDRIKRFLKSLPGQIN